MNKYNYALIVGFLTYSVFGFTQNITINDMFYLNTVSSDTLVNDSILENDVRILFSTHYDSISQILENPIDTSFYKALKNNLILMVPTTLNSYEINLQNLQKEKDTYILKCMILYSPKNMGVTDLFAFVKLPFRIHANEIKFGNYFKENSEDKFINRNDYSIYTNKENHKNIDSITNYIQQISTTFNISSEFNPKLFYIYYSKQTDPYELVGLENFAGADQGRAPSFGNYVLIFDRFGGGFYKHELVHFINSQNHLSGFFDEGFASYLGGSSWKCNNLCDYEMLLHFLEKNDSDSVILKIIKDKYADNIIYQQYYYALGSITTYFMIKKFGTNLMNDNFTCQILKDNSPDNIYTFLLNNLDTSGKRLCDYYITELREYINEKK